MKDISKEISHYTHKFQIACPEYVDDVSSSRCNRPGGCACEKFGEIHGLIHSLVKPEYRRTTVFSFTGRLPGPSGDKSQEVEVIPVTEASEIRKKLGNYLYGDYKKAIPAKMKDGTIDRAILNNVSQLDKRFSEGTNVIIYGENQMNAKSGGRFVPKKRPPAGKTLLASIILIDAINRRAFSSNKASSYEWVSFLQLRHMMKSKMDTAELDSIQEADWLVIDDIGLIVGADNTRADLWTREVFDSFLIERIENKKPTILVCEFDLENESLHDKMGAAFEKIARSSQTCLIKV